MKAVEPKKESSLIDFFDNTPAPTTAASAPAQNVFLSLGGFGAGHDQFSNDGFGAPQQAPPACPHNRHLAPALRILALTQILLVPLRVRHPLELRLIPFGAPQQQQYSSNSNRCPRCRRPQQLTS